MEGLLLLCAKMGRTAAVEIPFCERTIYNLAIDLFMCLHRLSLDASGHVWEANVFMALFLISQAIFPPTAFCVYGGKPNHHGRLFLKIASHSFHERSVWLARICGVAPFVLLKDWQEEGFSFIRTFIHRAAPARRSFYQNALQRKSWKSKHGLSPGYR